ncbi:hypothetical protein BDD12DRAFT_164071 [Trichophaea hybrida]|nr:hypothetical protein BDD12DRAFT_164071 [Trichophaea hybrida]
MALALNTPLAEALNNRIQPKLVEIGWSVGDDNSPLGEYICLMMVNGKSQDQIASELSGDLLGLGPDDASAAQFARWLFDELEALKKSMGEANSNTEKSVANGDEEMGDVVEETPEGAPTAPKAMRHPNPRRLINQLTKAMERKPQDVLHRVRSQPSERIDKFKRDPPKGPSRPHGPSRHNNMNNNRHHQNRMNGRSFGPNQPMLPQNITPQQQMAFYQMYQQQSHMIAPFTNGPMSTPPFPGHIGMPHGGQHMHPPGAGIEDAYSNNLSQPQRAGGSLFERIQAPPELNNDSQIDTNEDKTEEGWNGSSKSEKLEEIPCKFGTGCTKPECPFGHPTPATPAGKPTQYISGEKCPFGSKCKNRKCTGSHPSPASAPGYHGGWPTKIEQDCKFFPNCTNPACPFKHPIMPMCRNGANCTRPDCHFTHAETACKFKPCLNPNCIYRHEEGQQQLAQPGENAFGHKVWTAPGKGKNGEHVSERKFVSGEGSEELIIPGQDMDTAPLDVE